MVWYGMVCSFIKLYFYTLKVSRTYAIDCILVNVFLYIYVYIKYIQMRIHKGKEIRKGKKGTTTITHST